MGQAKRTLSETQIEALQELSSITEVGGWVKTRWLSGSRGARSSKNLKSLVAIGLAESTRPGESPRPHENSRQLQYRWRITPAGRTALSAARATGGTE